MALRRLLVTFCGIAGVLAAQVKRYPLDERSSYLVTIGTEAPTTVVFPDVVTAIDGANMSAKAEENPPVLLAHAPGASFFALRALKADAIAAVNVIVRGRPYALTFRAGGTVDRTVTFTEEAVATTDEAPRRTVARLVNVLDRAKAWPLLAEQYPTLASRIQRALPGNFFSCAGLGVTVEEVLKFEAEDTIVLTLRLENPRDTLCRYAADRMEVAIGTRAFPVALSDASGEVPARSAVQCRVAICGMPDGSRADLAVTNEFRVTILPRA